MGQMCSKGNKTLKRKGTISSRVFSEVVARGTGSGTDGMGAAGSCSFGGLQWRGWSRGVWAWGCWSFGGDGRRGTLKGEPAKSREQPGLPALTCPNKKRTFQRLHKLSTTGRSRSPGPNVFLLCGMWVLRA